MIPQEDVLIEFSFPQNEKSFKEKIKEKNLRLDNIQDATILYEDNAQIKKRLKRLVKLSYYNLKLENELKYLENEFKYLVTLFDELDNKLADIDQKIRNCVNIKNKYKKNVRISAISIRSKINDLRLLKINNYFY